MVVELFAVVVGAITFMYCAFKEYVVGVVIGGFLITWGILLSIADTIKLLLP